MGPSTQSKWGAILGFFTIFGFLPKGRASAASWAISFLPGQLGSFCLHCFVDSQRSQCSRMVRFWTLSGIHPLQLYRNLGKDTVVHWISMGIFLNYTCACVLFVHVRGPEVNVRCLHLVLGFRSHATILLCCCSEIRSPSLWSRHFTSWLSYLSSPHLCFLVNHLIKGRFDGREIGAICAWTSALAEWEQFWQWCTAFWI